MSSSNPSNGPIRIHLDDELEGEHVGTTDYFFVKIGEAVPLKPNDSNFDLERLPSTPLAVSERFGLIFVAHSSGFFVARTKDVMDSAKEFKEKGSGPPIQQLSFVDVSIGKVNILTLSADNSTVAASVSGDIRFFSVDNLLNKEVKQSFSCSLNDSSYVKDMRWITKSEKSYVVLSNMGKLYYGEVDIPLKDVMDSVDAVEWGVEGKCVAVARMNVISILSAKFEEQVSILLSFRSWIGDSRLNCRIKVDSIKWVRPDSIIVGSFQLTEDGKEENYLLQVIRCRDGEITDACSELFVQSFYDIYQGLIDDIVPSGCGPYLLLTYLEQCQLAISANRKNTDQHIMLLGWSVDDYKSEAVVVDVERDNWVPRIELQENGDDNMVLGLCVDNISIYQKVGIQLGVEERTELTPYCILICLTLEGKLVMFHVACLSGNEVYPEKSSVLPDEENDASLKLPVEQCSTLLHGSLKQELEQASEEYMNLRSKHFPNPHQMPLIEDITKSQEVESLAHLQSLKPDGQQIVSDVKLNQESEGENPCPSLEHNAKLGQFSSSAFLEQFSRIGTQKIGGLEYGPGSFTVESAAPGLSSYNNLRETTEKTNELQSKTGLWNSLIASSYQSTGENFSLTKESNVSSFSMLSNAQVSAHQTQIYRMGNANVNAAKVHANLAQKPFDVHNKDGVLPAVNYASGPVQSEGQQTSIGAGNTGALSICSSQLPVNENIAVGKSSIHKFRASNEQHKASSMLGIPTFEPNLSKQFGNIHEMTKELDVLLRSIEEAGGFRDTCTRSLLSSVEALEQRMETLSNNCKLWTFEVDEQLEEVYHLLDKTVQVVARKMYMEGVFNQASDRRYWDIWNQQKLNSELELKQQHILSLNQDLTNQLIELEGHFNVLELNKFSEYGGTHVGHGATQSRYRPSRYIQSLYSVHNAVNSQLVAAENLSECLSKQMTALSVKSPSDEQKNVKMELFETVGIPYEPSFGSPDMKGVINTPSTKPVFSDLITNKDRSKKHQACTIKGCEPEMSRRRRDSLDQSWTCFEPPKTIVRRMLLQEVKRPNLNTSLFSMDKENISLFMLERSPHQIDSRIPATMFPETDKKAAGIQVAPPEEVSEHSKALIWANHLSTLTQHSVNSESRRKHDFPFSASSTIPAASTLLGKVTQSNVKSPPSEKISAVLTFGGSFESPSPTIQTSMASPLSSSVSSETVPSPAVSVDLSRSLTSSNTSIDANQIRPASSAPESPSLLTPSLILSNPTAKHTLSSFPHPSSVNSNLEVLKPEVQQVFISNLKIDLDAYKDVSTLKIETPNSESKLRPEPAGKCSPTSVSSSGGLSNDIKSSAPNIISVSWAEQHIDAPMQFSTSFPASAGVTTGKIESLDAGITGEDEMDEEAPEISNTTEPSLGSSSGFGIGSLSHPSTPKSNPFGGSFSNGETNLTTSTITFSVPSGELFRPASFTFPSSEYSAPALSTNSGVFSGGISAGTTVSATTQSVFGQPSQVGSGQQALGSVLGTFGQSRQLGSGLPGSGFGGGFAVSNSSSGFSSAATGGGFAGVSGGGFSGIASTFGGFAGGASVGARSAGGGFAAVSSAGGFAGAASGGFGAFSSQGSGGFAAFGTSGGTSKPPELFTQMRK